MNQQAKFSQHDMAILEHYAATRNRELYWNYLAQLPGNDGYGRLALGVVRNDNMPGATANAYAQAYALEHNGKVFTEREWDDFGVDLIRNDAASRARHLAKGSAERALNLPAMQIQEAHDLAFANMEVDPNAWTPRKLLEAARTHGEAEAEKVWTNMLNNDALGFHRGKDTLLDLAANEGMSGVDRATYARDMAAAYGKAINERSHDNPNVIGSMDHYYMRDRNGEWAEMHHVAPTIGVRHHQMDDVRDPGMLRQLEDTHDLRRDREEARKAFHPNDPGQLIRSPHPLADHGPRVSLPGPDDDPLYAALRRKLPMEVTNDKVAEVALEARSMGVRRPEHLEEVAIRGGNIICEGTHCRGCIEVDRHSPAPPMEQSLDQARQLDQQAIDMQMQQQLAMQQTGPSMAR